MPDPSKYQSSCSRILAVTATRFAGDYLNIWCALGNDRRTDHLESFGLEVSARRGAKVGIVRVLSVPPARCATGWKRDATDVAGQAVL